MEEGQSLPELRKLITQDVINSYAAASGDDNLIHIDADFASHGPFGRIVAHGMLVLACISEMLTEAFGRSWLESGRLKVRFRAPVYPDEEVVTFGSIVKLNTDENGHLVRCRIGCRKLEGPEVITGEAFIHMPGDSTSISG